MGEGLQRIVLGGAPALLLRLLGALLEREYSRGIGLLALIVCLEQCLLWSSASSELVGVSAIGSGTSNLPYSTAYSRKTIDRLVDEFFVHRGA